MTCLIYSVPGQFHGYILKEGNPSDMEDNMTATNKQVQETKFFILDREGKIANSQFGFPDDQPQYLRDINLVLDAMERPPC